MALYLIFRNNLIQHSSHYLNLYSIHFMNAMLCLRNTSGSSWFPLLENFNLPTGRWSLGETLLTRTIFPLQASVLFLWASSPPALTTLVTLIDVVLDWTTVLTNPARFVCTSTFVQLPQQSVLLCHPGFFICSCIKLHLQKIFGTLM